MRVVVLAGVFLFSAWQNAQACSTMIAGKGATADGSILFGRSADTPSPTMDTVLRHSVKLTEDKEFIPNEDTIGDKFKNHIIPAAGSLSYFSTPLSLTVKDGHFSFEQNGMNDAGVSMSATETVFTEIKISDAWDKLD